MTPMESDTLIFDPEDFTETRYRELIDIAKSRYNFIRYEDVCSSRDFILWRHDVDCSLNRAVRLGGIEFEKGVCATYFLNIHSEYYNLLERAQDSLVRQLLAMGHDLGVHLDSRFYALKDEDQLEACVEIEADFFQKWYGKRPRVFSFHNPDSVALAFEKDKYAGLINCYSKTFKTSIEYCSDSNGYWRFKRLKDVLLTGKASRMHVLTHPEWWQRESMSPRERIYRCVYERAAAVMKGFDSVIRADGRLNHGRLNAEFEFLKSVVPRHVSQLEGRWMQGEAVSVFVDLWRHFDTMLWRTCRVLIRRGTGMTNAQTLELLEMSEDFPIHRLYVTLLKKEWSDLVGVTESTYLGWSNVRNWAVQGRGRFENEIMANGIAFLVSVWRTLNESIDACQDALRVGIFESVRKATALQLPADSPREWFDNNGTTLSIDSKTAAEGIQNARKLVRRYPPRRIVGQ